MKAKPKILVIDDDSDILEAIKITLEDEGYEVRISSHPNKITNSNLPDLIILDVLLSGSDGREVSKSLRVNELTKNIPIILVSADNASKKNFSKSQATDFISKPFDIDDLISMIKKYLPKS